MGSHYVDEAVSKLKIAMLQLPKLLGLRAYVPHLAYSPVFNFQSFAIYCELLNCFNGGFCCWCDAFCLFVCLGFFFLISLHSLCYPVIM